MSGTQQALLMAASAGGGGGVASTFRWNPAENGWFSLSLGDTRAFDASNNNASVRADIGCDSSSKKYWELSVDTISNSSEGYLGLQLSSVGYTNYSNNYFLVPNGTVFETGGTNGGSPGSFTAGDILMGAYDGATGKYWIGKNGSWTSGDPSAGTSPNYTFSSIGTYKPCLRRSNNNSATCQFTIQATLNYSLPSGFTAL